MARQLTGAVGPRRAPHRLTLTAGAALGALSGVVVLTLLVATWPAVNRFDTVTAGPVINPDSALGQILQALALVSTPHLTYVVCLILAAWAWRQRLFNTARAIICAVPLGIGFNLGVKHLLVRPRPPSAFADTLTLSGFAYPSGHMTGVVVLAILAVALRHKRRSDGVSLGGSYAVAIVGVAVVAANRWLMRAHYLSDIVGGALLGAAVAWGSLAVAQLIAQRHHSSPAATVRVSEPRLAAIVYNPVKFDDLSMLRRRADYEFSHHGWQAPLWFETTADDPGADPTRWALERGVDRIVAAGGDGTIRAVATVLADQVPPGASHPTPLGVLPSGTGNILAHNLSIPLDQDAAFAIALTGQACPLDLIRLRSTAYVGYCLVIAGMGIDAAAMAGTNPELKRLVGSTAYFLSIIQQLHGEAFDVTIRLDDNEPVTRRTLTAMIGNAGATMLPIRLFPAARLDDGLLDLLVLSPSTTLEWTRVGIDLLASNVASPSGGKEPPEFTTTDHSAEPIEFAQGKTIRLETTTPVPWQIDGDLIGETDWIEAEIVPAAIQVMVRPGALN